MQPDPTVPRPGRRSTPRRSLLLAVRAGLLSTGALALGGCQTMDRWPVIETQRIAGPMVPVEEPLPPGVEGLHPRGVEEVLVVRHADPVQVQPAGLSAAFPLAFYDKQRRLNAGSWIYTNPGSRAEVIWPGGSTLLLFGRCTGVIGSPARGEPTFLFRELEVARLYPQPGDRFQLLGGAILEAAEGPFRVERLDHGVLRVRSQAQVHAEILFREELFRLDPGQAIDLPLLDVPGVAAVPLPGATIFQGPGFEVLVDGAADLTERSDGMLLVGRGEHEARALGVRVQLGSGERILFTGLGSPAARAPAEVPAAEVPAPEPPDPDPATTSAVP